MSEATAPTAQFNLNGVPCALPAIGTETLATFLRRATACSSIHIGCDEGVCGVCTVLVNGRSARACLTLAAQIQDCTVMTAEGLAADSVGARVQAAFIEQHAAQCGYCTPGFVILARELLTDYAGRPAPTREVLLQRLSAVACRCTGYAPIVAALEQLLSARNTLAP